uniref:TMEM205-like domain-containing protein n=1 Tax=Aegilops tauschii TaxID=37682 RepID=M8BT21_AEGTA
MWLLVMAAFFLASAAVAFGPEGLLGSSPATTAVKTAHLLFFATSLGATVWAILVSGLVMFLHLPRHVMGRLRGKVFPACFKLNAACTAVSAAAFAWLHYPWKATPAVERRQLGLLVATVGFDLANLFLLAPKTLKVH